MKTAWVWIERALGVSLLSGAVSSVAMAEPGERYCIARLTLALLQGAVGVLILLRGPLRISARPAEIAAALPSFLWGAAVMSLARPWSSWPVAAEVLFVIGGAGVILSLATLGRCFAILPGARGVVARGPFRMVRHPAYACELVMLVGCGLALGSWWRAAGAVVIAAVLIAARVIAEERALGEIAEYRAYVKRTRWRLLPGAW